MADNVRNFTVNSLQQFYNKLNTEILPSYAAMSYVQSAYSYIINEIVDNEYVIAQTFNSHNDRLTTLETAGYITSETQPDWNVTDTSSPAYIKNKPAITVEVDNVIDETSYNAASSYAVAKALNDTEYAVGMALNDLNSKIANAENSMDDLYNDLENNFVRNYTLDERLQNAGYLTSETQPDWNVTSTTSAAYIKNKPDPIIIGQNWRGFSMNDSDITITQGGRILLTDGFGDIVNTNGGGYVTLQDAINSVGDSLIFNAIYGQTTFSEISTAIQAGKLVVVHYDEDWYYLNNSWHSDDYYHFISIGSDYLNSQQSIKYLTCLDLPAATWDTPYKISVPIVPDFTSAYVGRVLGIKNQYQLEWKDIPAQVQSNWNETNSSSAAYIQNKPTIPSIAGLVSQTTLSNQSYVTTTTLNTRLDNAGYISSIPSEYVTQNELSANGYLTSFTESDPTVPSHVKSITQANINAWNSYANVQADWNATSGDSYIKNKPTIPTDSSLVHTTGQETINGKKIIQGELALGGNVGGQNSKITLDEDSQINMYLASSYIYMSNIDITNNSSVNIKSSDWSYVKRVGSGNSTVTLQDDLNAIKQVPSYSSSDEGKVLSVNSSGQLVWITPVSIYTGNGEPSNSTGNDGDIYLQS